jgi:hypothetical protein
MRIIGNIEHPSLKISVFKNEGRTSVKFETSLYEQTYKLGDDERFSTVEGVEEFVDAAMLEKIVQVYQQKQCDRLESMTRNFPVQTEAVFEEII